MDVTDPKYIKDTCDSFGKNCKCPEGGQLVYGKAQILGTTGQQRIPSFRIYTTTPYECYMTAAELIELHNGWSFMEIKTPKQNLLFTMLDTYKKDANLGTNKILGFSASFYLNRAKAPFGENCHIEFGECPGLDANREVLTVTGSHQTHASKLSACTIPFKRNDCLKSQVSKTRSPICTWTTAETPNPCFEWLIGLPDERGDQIYTLNKREQANLICEKYPELAECDCIARDSRRLFNNLKPNFTAVSDICWYMPCKLEGYDRQITPADRLQRANCNTTVCQNIVNVAESSGNSLDELKQAINCSAKEWEKIPGGQGGGGQGGDGDGKGVQAWVITIIVTVIILIGVGVLYFFAFKEKASPKPTPSPPPPPSPPAPSPSPPPPSTPSLPSSTSP